MMKERQKTSTEFWKKSFFQHVTKSDHNNRTGKTKVSNGKEDKIALYGDDYDLLCKKNLRVYTQKLLEELINNFAAEYQVMVSEICVAYY